jgi:hypothetical protein
LLLVCKHLRVVVSELPFPASSSKQGCQYQAGFSVQASGSNHAYHDQTQYTIELTFSNRIYSVQHARRSLDLCHTATVMFRFWEWISKVELPSIAAIRYSELWMGLSGPAAVDLPYLTKQRVA